MLAVVVYKNIFIMRTNNQVAHKFILFLLNPFVAAVLSLKKNRDRISIRILYFWFLMFGIGFCAVNDQLDSYRIIADFHNISGLSWNSYFLYLSEYFSFDTDIKDIYAVTIQFLVSRFTDNYHWVFLFFAAVFGFFYVSSLKLFLRYEAVGNLMVYYSLLFMFCYSNPIFNINGMRFWTAAWIGVFVLLSIVLEKNYKMLVLLILTPFMHGTFLIWGVLFFVAFLTQKYQKIWIVLFIASSFVSAVSYINILHDYSYLLPHYMQNLVYSYTEADRAVAIMSGQTSYKAAYANVLNSLPGCFCLLMSYLLIFNLNALKTEAKVNRLMRLYIPLAAMTNFLSGIPSMVRYEKMMIPLLVIIWAMSYSKMQKYNWIFSLIPLVYFYSLLYFFRHVSTVTEIPLYVMPAPFIVFYYLF